LPQAIRAVERLPGNKGQGISTLTFFTGRTFFAFICMYNYI